MAQLTQQRVGGEEYDKNWQQRARSTLWVRTGKPNNSRIAGNTGKPDLWSRNGLPLGQKFPAIAIVPFFDVFPLSVITTSTLAPLKELRPQSRFEPRRFRVNLIVRTEQPGFIENGWVGHKLQLGAPYEVNKGTIRFPLCEPVPLKLIQRHPML